MKILKRFFDILKLIRAFTVFTSCVLALAILYIASNRDFSVYSMETKIYLMISCSCLTMGTMILNDVFDVEEDKINNLDKPIANGSVGRVPAAISGTLCLIIAVLLSYLIDKKYSVCMLISSLICAFYSPLLKPFGILKNISTCFVTSLIVFALFRYVPKVTVYPKEIEKLIQTIEGDQNLNSQKSTENNQIIEACDTPETLVTHILISLFLFFWNFSDELIMDIRDYEGDKASGINTLVVKIGHKLGFLLSCLCIVISFVLFVAYTLLSNKRQLVIVYISIFGFAPACLLLIDCWKKQLNQSVVAKSVVLKGYLNFIVIMIFTFFS